MLFALGKFKSPPTPAQMAAYCVYPTAVGPELPSPYNIQLARSDRFSSIRAFSTKMLACIIVELHLGAI